MPTTMFGSARCARALTSFRQNSSKWEMAIFRPDGTAGNNGLYPSIRKLPLLGVTYAALYREQQDSGNRL